MHDNCDATAVNGFAFSPSDTLCECARYPPRRGERHLKPFQVLDDDSGHGEVPEPLVVGRDDKPRGVLGAATRECILVSRRIVVPVGSLLVIGLADFPLLGRVVEPILEAFQLLPFGDVQEELEDMRVVLDEAALESVDSIVTAGPDLLGPGYERERSRRPRSVNG